MYGRINKMDGWIDNIDGYDGLVDNVDGKIRKDG